jgi:hypothetical protein
VYVPATGLNVGVAAVGGVVVMVYAAEPTVELVYPDSVAIA